MAINRTLLRFGAHKVTIYQRSDVIDSSWFMRVRLKDEHRYFKKSLGTKDKDEATERAHTELINLFADIQSGQRIFSISLGELLKRFQVNQQQMADSGQLSIKTVHAQSYRVRSLGMRFLATKYPLGANTKLSQVNGAVFEDYLAWRPDIRRDVVHEELLTIRKMFVFGVKNNLCTERAIPTWDFIVEREGPKRQRITGIDQFRTFIQTTHDWAREDESYNRRMVIQVIALAALSGMRSGEIFGLRNSDVTPRGPDEFVIDIRPETSKVRKARTINVQSDVLGVWLKKVQVHKGQEAHLFCPADDPKKPVRNVFYQQYAQLRVRLKTVGLEWFDLYHCRHWYITNQLLAEQPIHLVAKVTGTSTAEIESTYSHVLTEMTSKKFGERKLKWSAGSYEIVKVLK